MRTYVALRYLSFAVPIAALMALAAVLMPDPSGNDSMPLGEAVSRALFWSTPVASWLAWRDLSRRNVWLLVDNLRINRFIALAVPTTGQLVLWAASVALAP